MNFMVDGVKLSAMKYRIPPAVAWLVKTRQQVGGRLEVAEKELSRMRKNEVALVEALQQMSALTSNLRADVKALDDAICMHEIGIDPATIQSLRIQRVSIAKANAKDSFTRSIFACLRRTPAGWKTSTEISTFVANRCHPDLSPAEFPLYRHHVKGRIQQLCAAGKLSRLDGRTGNQEGRYRLADQHSYAQLTDTEVQHFDSAPPHGINELSVDSTIDSTKTGEQFALLGATVVPTLPAAIVAFMKSEPTVWRTTTEIVNSVAGQCRPHLPEEDVKVFRRAVRARICLLVDRRILERMVGRTKIEEGRYRLIG